MKRHRRGEKAWLNTQHLWPLPVLRGTFLAAIDGFTAVIGKTLLVPYRKGAIPARRHYRRHR